MSHELVPQSSQSVPVSDTDRLTLTSIALRQLSRLDALQQITLLIAGSSDLEASLPAIARAIFEQFGLQSVGIGMIDEGWIEYRGLAAEVRPVSGRTADPSEFDLRRPLTGVWESEATQPSASTVEYDTTDLGHAARLPILVDGRRHGVLTVTARDDARIDGELIEIFGRITEALGVGFEREARTRRAVPAGLPGDASALLEIVSRIAALTQVDSAIQAIMADISELLNVSVVSLLLSGSATAEHYSSSPAIGSSMDEESLRLRSLPVVRRAMGTLQSQVGVIAPDDQGADTGGPALVVPLVVQGDAAGVILLERGSRPTFTDSDLEAAAIVGRHLSFAIQRERRIRSFSRQNLLLSLVERLTAFIARATTADDLLTSLAREVRRTFGYDCSIAMIVENRLIFRAIEMNSPHEMPAWIDDGIPLGVGVMGRVARTGQPAFIRDVADEPHFLDTGANTLSEICVPIRVDGDVVGVINVESDASNPLDDLDFEVISILANHIGIALNNGRLIAAERESRRAVEAIQRVSTIVAETLDPDEALRRIADTLADILDYPVVTLAVLDGGNLVRKASHGYDPDAMETVLTFDHGISGRVVRTGEPVLLEDVRTDPDYIHARGDLTSEVCVPIRCNGEIVGILNVEGTEERPVTRWDLELLTTFAEHAGVLLNNARAYAALSQEATLDPMTGVPNLRYFQQQLHVELEQARREERPLSLAVIDVDNLKEINDTYGHLIGDQALRELARRMSAELRGEDLLARYAGDEFVALLPGVDGNRAIEIAGRLLDAARRQPFSTSETPPIALSLSIGVATFPEDAAASTELLRAADMAMYVAKESGKDGASTARQSAMMRNRTGRQTRRKRP